MIEKGELPCVSWWMNASVCSRSDRRGLNTRPIGYDRPFVCSQWLLKPEGCRIAARDRRSCVMPVNTHLSEFRGANLRVRFVFWQAFLSQICPDTKRTVHHPNWSVPCGTPENVRDAKDSTVSGPIQSGILGCLLSNDSVSGVGGAWSQPGLSGTSTPYG